MVRPSDWDVLGPGHDPTPGDPFRVKEISGRMRDIGDEAERALARVRPLHDQVQRLQAQQSD